MDDQGLWRAGYLREREVVIAEFRRTVAEQAEPLQDATEQLEAHALHLAKPCGTEQGPEQARWYRANSRYFGTYIGDLNLAAQSAAPKKL